MESRNLEAFFCRFFFGVLLNLPWIYLLVLNEEWYTLLLAAISASFMTCCGDKCLSEILTKRGQFLIDLVVFVVMFYLLRKYLLFG